MSETNAPEPTMEEILASIRRIISEDDAPAPAAAETATSPGDPPEPRAAPPHHDDVLELTDRVEPEAPPAAPPAAVSPSAPPPPPPEATPAAAPPPASLGDLDFAPSAPAAASTPPPPKPSPEPARAGGEEPLVGDRAAGRAADHFGALASSIAMPAGGRTLEDVVRELLRPMLKEWLDQHLPAIVEARVQDEVERISRRRTY